MSANLEERVAQLEAQVADLQAVAHPADHVSSKQALMATFGLHEGDPHFENAARLGEEWRGRQTWEKENAGS